MIEHALQYASRGWAIFPIHTTLGGKCSCGRSCASPGKHPRIKGGFKAASRDPATIEIWWHRWPTANIGVATGAVSGLTVLDIDGAEGFQELTTLLGQQAMPATLAAQTGSGAHLYFISSGEGTSARGKLHVRGEGGYCVIPPSFHPSGRNYQWLNSLSPIPLPEILKQYAQGAGLEGEKPRARFAALGPVPEYLQGFQQHSFKIGQTAATILRKLYGPTDIEEVQSALQVLDPDMKMLDWVKVGMALHSLGWERPDGTDIGRDLWEEWSARGTKFTGTHEIETRWRSFGGAARGTEVGLGTLFHMARKAGWIREREPPAEEGGEAAGDSLAGAAVAATLVNQQPAPAVSQPFNPFEHKGINGHASISATALIPALPASFTNPERPIRWTDRDENGKPRPTCTSAMQAIQHMGIVCQKDVFHEKLMVGGHMIQQWAGDLSDDAVQMLRRITKDRYGFDAGEKNVRDAAVQLCLRHQFNPVTDYLAGLQWDGRPRLARWVVDYLGADDNPFSREAGRLMLVAAARRARQPGCKFDQIIVLEGPQGTYKSTAVRILAGEENYSEQAILTASDKEQQEAVCGVWLYELAELAGLRRADTERVKQFASRTVDRARPAYGRLRVDRKRTCVFVATTNQQAYLRDETGNRRFWPIETRRIDIDGIARDRDQLWAEAATQEAAGVPLVMDTRLWVDAAYEQHKRIEIDDWEDPIQHFLDKPVEGEERQETSVYEVLTSPPLLLAPSDVNQGAQNRAARILVKLGWERFRKREGKHNKWRYRLKQ